MEYRILLANIFQAKACLEAENRHKITYFEGNIAQDIGSAKVFHGIAEFCKFFAIKGLFES
jgi:hypothetical protein